MVINNTFVCNFLLEKKNIIYYTAGRTFTNGWRVIFIIVLACVNAAYNGAAASVAPIDPDRIFSRFSFAVERAFEFLFAYSFS